jgi:hypothetical protein
MKLTSACLGLAVSLLARAGMAAQDGTVAQRFQWLEGCWAGARRDTRFREIWTVAGPDLMLGMGTTSAGSKPAEFDYFRIETRDGRPAYVAQPGGVPPTVFSLQPSSPPDAPVFANPAHDYPKRVGYRRVNASSLLAFIDGGDGGARRVEFPMERVGCPGTR